MPQVYIAKYNKFVDTIIGRINKVLGKSFDPVRVKLIPSDSKNQTKTKSGNKKKGSKKTSKNHPESRHKLGDLEIARAVGEDKNFVLISKNSASTSEASPIAKENNEGSTRASGNKKKNKTKSGSKSGSKKGKNTQRARATLFGLSSLRREGDVSVNMMSTYTMVKTDFLIGPLTLRVEKEVSYQDI